MSVDPEDTRPQRYRENTVRSLAQAAQAGASFVEFDVQVRAASARALKSPGHLFWPLRCCLPAARMTATEAPNCSMSVGEFVARQTALWAGS